MADSTGTRKQWRVVCCNSVLSPVEDDFERAEVRATLLRRNGHELRIECREITEWSTEAAF